jgi:predicted metal-dependent phosphoesterase TrpH
VSARVDLHLHTTASDGRCTPAELVDQAVQAGLSVIAVTDHDTTGAVREVESLARQRGIIAVSGIEITSMEQGRDLHVLGYFFDPAHRELDAFLAAQRRARVARVQAIAERLAALGMPVNASPLIDAACRETSRSIGRPQLARAMVAAGYVADTREAFDRWLRNGAPAFVARAGPTPEETIAIIHAAGGMASLAHPGAAGIRTERISALAASGLDAIEVFHSDHDASLTERYGTLARQLDVLMTGGSDFHGDPSHGVAPGTVTLPDPEWERLQSAHHGAGGGA